MTDWIEVLLAEQREFAPAGQAPELGPGTRIPRADSGRFAEEEPAVPEAGDGLNGREPLRPAGATEGESGDGDWLAGVRLELADGELFPLRLAVKAAEPLSGQRSEPPRQAEEAWEKAGVPEEGAGWLWRALTAGEHALEAGTARPVRAEEPALSQEAPLDAGMLDRMAERDARRYDGGFQLY